MELVCVGEIVNTHGIKGEIRIISNFKYKEDIFKKGFILYLGRFKDKQIINTYRKHKNYDMVTFDGINNINDVLIYKGEYVYIDRRDLQIDGFLSEDLIGYIVLMGEKMLGKVYKIINNNAHDIFVVKKDKEKIMVPFVDDFIKEIKQDDKVIYLEEVDGLINEN